MVRVRDYLQVHGPRRRRLDGGLKRFETGVNASVAVHLSSLYFRLGSDIGLTNIYKNKADEGSLKNASFYLGVGLRF